MKGVYNFMYTFQDPDEPAFFNTQQKEFQDWKNQVKREDR